MNKHRGGVKKIIIEDMRIGLREQIIEYIEKKKRVIVKQIMEDFRLPTKTVEYQLKVLKDDGVINSDNGLIKLQGSVQYQRMNVFCINHRF